METEEILTDFELFSRYFLYDETLDTVFNRVSRRRASEFNVSGFVNDMDDRIICFRGKNYQGHRIAHLLKHGRWPDSYLCKRDSAYLCNSTTHRNISFHSEKEKYILNLTNRHGKSRYCGIFLTLGQAVAAKERLLQTDEFRRD